MKKVLIVPILLVLMGGFAFAFSADFATNLTSIVSSFLVTWDGSYTQDINDATIGEVYYLTGTNEKLSSCSGNAVEWDSNVSMATINFTLTELIENSVDFKLEIGGNDFDLNVGTSEYSFPITGLSQKVCLKAIITGEGINNKITTSDFNIVVG